MSFNKVNRVSTSFANTPSRGRINGSRFVQDQNEPRLNKCVPPFVRLRGPKPDIDIACIAFPLARSLMGIPRAAPLKPVDCKYSPLRLSRLYLMADSMTIGTLEAQTRISPPVTLPRRAVALTFLSGLGNQSQTSSTWHWRNLKTTPTIPTTPTTSGRRSYVWPVTL